MLTRGKLSTCNSVFLQLSTVKHFYNISCTIEEFYLFYYAVGSWTDILSIFSLSCKQHRRTSFNVFIVSYWGRGRQHEEGRDELALRYINDRSDAAKVNKGNKIACQHYKCLYICACVCVRTCVRAQWIHLIYIFSVSCLEPVSRTMPKLTGGYCYKNP